MCGESSAQGSKRGESQAVYGKERNALLLTVCLSHKSFAGVEKIYFFADNDSIRDNVFIRSMLLCNKSTPIIHLFLTLIE